MQNLENFKVLFFAIIGIIISFLETSPLDFLRYVAVFLTIGYTLHRWYIMYKRNRNKNNLIKKDEEN